MRWSEEDYKDFINKQSINKKKTNKNTKKNTKKKSKYNNIKTELDGIVFDSKGEARRYTELKVLEKVGAISELELQPKFELQPTFKKNGKTHRSITYTADFRYIDDKGKIIIEDYKGMETQIFKMKKKMFEYQYSQLELKIVK